MAHKPKRVGFMLDMTPLVDVAFLLLTFFMFTAKFKSDADNEQKFEVKRPTATADSTHLPDLGTAIVKIGIDPKSKDTAMYYAVSNEKQRQAIYSVLPDAGKNPGATILVPDTNALAQLVRATRSTDNKIQFAIDADKRIDFRRIQAVMNTFRSQGATIFNFVTVKTGDEKPAPAGS